MTQGNYTTVTVLIRRNADGLVREHRDEYWSGEPYMWQDGNYSCDCNRGMFFCRAGDPPEDEGGCDCGDGAYSVQIKDGAGKVLYEDDAWAFPAPPLPA